MANEYDKIIKESLTDVVGVLIRKVLGINSTRITPLETKMQITNEREADFIFEIEEYGTIYILHIEFQATNDYNMPHRMLFYWNFITVNHRKPVRQCLFYIGKETLRMSNKIPGSQENAPYPKLSSYDYELIDFRTIDCDAFIKSNDPKSIVISILCDYKDKDVTIFIREILERIRSVVKEETLRSKYIRQLEVLSRLRDMQDEFSKEVDKMPIILDIEGDVRFRQGMEKGRVKGLKEGIEQGIEKGIEQGHERGLMEGIEQGLIEGIEQGHERGLMEGIEQGLIEGIELALEIKFGNSSLVLMDKIQSINDIKKLEGIKESIKKAANLEEFVNIACLNN